MEQIKALLDAVVSADTLASRQAAANKVFAAVESKLRAAQAPPAVVTLPPVVNEPPVVTETVRYADGSSATGAAPLPDHSPEGSPAVSGTVTVVTNAVIELEPAPAPAAFTKTTIPTK